MRAQDGPIDFLTQLIQNSADFFRVGARGLLQGIQRGAKPVEYASTPGNLGRFIDNYEERLLKSTRYSCFPDCPRSEATNRSLNADDSRGLPDLAFYLRSKRTSVECIRVARKPDRVALQIKSFMEQVLPRLSQI